MSVYWQVNTSHPLHLIQTHKYPLPTISFDQSQTVPNTTQHSTKREKRNPQRKKTFKMQAASCFVQPLFPSKCGAKKPTPTLTPPKTPSSSSRSSSIKAAATAFEPLSFNYNSPFSVFPAEAMETIGGEACPTYMFPEVKLKKPQGGDVSKRVASSEPDREYFDYNSEPTSVLRAEACDDIGGEFCGAPYNYTYGM